MPLQSQVSERAGHETKYHYVLRLYGSSELVKGCRGASTRMSLAVTTFSFSLCQYMTPDNLSAVRLLPDASGCGSSSDSREPQRILLGRMSE